MKEKVVHDGYIAPRFLAIPALSVFGWWSLSMRRDLYPAVHPGDALGKRLQYRQTSAERNGTPQVLANDGSKTHTIRPMCEEALLAKLISIDQRVEVASIARRRA